MRLVNSGSSMKVSLICPSQSKGYNYNQVNYVLGMPYAKSR